MFVLKLRKIGKSVGFIVPEKMLEHLHAKEGKEVFAIETPSGYSLTTREPGVRKQVEAGEAFMDRYCDVFADLAKLKSPSDSR
jgi:antitoxin component of MazEF toxin-antitoxin module